MEGWFWPPFFGRGKGLDIFQVDGKTTRGSIFFSFFCSYCVVIEIFQLFLESLTPNQAQYQIPISAIQNQMLAAFLNPNVKKISNGEADKLVKNSLLIICFRYYLSGCCKKKNVAIYIANFFQKRMNFGPSCIHIYRFYVQGINH